MYFSKTIDAIKGNIIENKSPTEVKKSICFAKERSLDEVRDNLFHMKIQIKKVVVTTIFYSSSQKNLISKTLVCELGLNTIAYVEPYPWRWLHKDTYSYISFTNASSSYV
jgi:hypothetical protein